jgi:hypothetical protein
MENLNTNYCISWPIKHIYSLKNVTEIRPVFYAPRVSITSKLINTRTSLTHLYCDYDFSGSDDNFFGFYD